jgi:hypothetical protein
VSGLRELRAGARVKPSRSKHLKAPLAVDSDKSRASSGPEEEYDFGAISQRSRGQCRTSDKAELTVSFQRNTKKGFENTAVDLTETIKADGEETHLSSMDQTCA